MKKRHEIYKEVLKQMLWEEKNEPNRMSGFCYSFSIILGIDMKKVNFLDYPELRVKRPTRMYNICRWFNPNSYTERIEILKQCIDDTKS